MAIYQVLMTTENYIEVEANNAKEAEKRAESLYQQCGLFELQCHYCGFFEIQPKTIFLINVET